MAMPDAEYLKDMFDKASKLPFMKILDVYDKSKTIFELIENHNATPDSELAAEKNIELLCKEVTGGLGSLAFPNALPGTGETGDMIQEIGSYLQGENVKEHAETACKQVSELILQKTLDNPAGVDDLLTLRDSLNNTIDSLSGKLDSYKDSLLSTYNLSKQQLADFLSEDKTIQSGGDDAAVGAGNIALMKDFNIPGVTVNADGSYSFKLDTSEDDSKLSATETLTADFRPKEVDTVNTDGTTTKTIYNTNYDNPKNTDNSWDTVTTTTDANNKVISQVQDNLDGSESAIFRNPDNGVIYEDDEIDADGSYTAELDDPDDGDWCEIDVYDETGVLKKQDINPDIKYGEFIGAAGNALAAQVISRLIHNNLEAAVAKKLSAAALQLALGQVGLGTGPNGVPLTPDAAFAENFVMTINTMLGSMVGSEEGAKLFTALKLPPQIGSIVGGVLGDIGAKQLLTFVVHDIIGSNAFGSPIQSVGELVTDLTSGLQAATGTFIISTIQSKILSAIFPNENEGAQIGGQIGTVVGSFIPAIGSFLGDIIGTLIGSLFGPGASVGPDAEAIIQYFANTNSFQMVQSAADNGGNVQIAQQMVGAEAAELGQILQATGSHIINDVNIMTTGYFKGRYYVAWGSHAPNPYPDNFADATSAVDFSVLSILGASLFSGGNPYMEFALHASNDATLDALISDLNVAHDYSLYIQNPLGFNMSIGMMNDPAKFQAWMTELARAKVLGLDHLTLSGDNLVAFTGTTAEMIANLSQLQILAQEQALTALNITDTVAGVTANLTNLLTISGTLPTSLTINDTAANIISHLSTLEPLVDRHTLIAVTLTDKTTPTFSLTAVQVVKYAPLLKEITSDYKLVVSDSTANINANFDLLQSFADKGVLSAITLTDKGNHLLSITAAQLQNDSDVLTAIGSGYKLQVSGVAAANAAALFAAGSVVVSITVSDTLANISANLAGLKKLATQHQLTLININTNTAANILTNIAAIQAITPITLNLVGITAADIAVNIAALQSLTASAVLKTISLLDNIADINAHLTAVQKLTAAHIPTAYNIIDTAGDITSNLATLQSWASTGILATINVKDSAAHLAGNLAALQAMAGIIPTAITLTDAGRPTIILTDAQAQQYAGMLAAAITQNYNLITNYADGHSTEKLINPTSLVTSEYKTYTKINATGILTDDLINLTDGTSKDITYNATADVLSEIKLFTGLNGTGSVTTDTHNWTKGGSQIQSFVNLDLGAVTEYKRYTGVNGSGALTQDWIDYADGTSKDEFFNPTSSITNETETWSGIDDTGVLLKNIINLKAGGSQEQLFSDLPDGVSAQYFNYTGANLTGKVKDVLANFTAGGSLHQLYTGLPSGIIGENIYYTGINATGKIYAESIDYTAGNSQVEIWNPSSDITTEFKYYSAADGGGTDNYNIINWTKGGSQKQIFTGLPAGETVEYKNYAGVNATGTLTQDIIDYTAGTSQVETFNPTSLIATEFKNYAGLDGTGTLISIVDNWKTGGSQEQLFTGPNLAAGANNAVLNFSGANMTGTLKESITNYATYSQDEVFSGLPSNVAAEVFYYTGANKTGTLFMEYIDYRAGNSDVELWKPSSGIASQINYATAANGSGTITKSLINWTAGGSQLRLFTGLPAGAVAEYKNYAGANAAGLLTKDWLDNADGSSTNIILNPASTISSQIETWSGLDTTGTLVKKTVNFKVGGSAVYSYTGLGTNITAQVYKYTGANGTGTITQNIFDSADGTSEVWSADISHGIINQCYGYSGVDGTGVLNWKVLDAADGTSKLTIYVPGTFAGDTYTVGIPMVSQVINFTGANGTGTVTQRLFNYADGSSHILFTTGFAAGVINHYQDFKGANGTGAMKDEWFDYSNGTSQEELFNPTGTIAAQYISYAGYDGAGGETGTTINWKAGGSTVYNYAGLDAGLVAHAHKYTGANGTGTVIQDIFDYKNGTSDIWSTDVAHGITNQCYDYSGADGTGTLNWKVLDAANGTSKLTIYVPGTFAGDTYNIGIPMVSQVINFTGANGTGTMTQRLFNYADGSSHILFTTGFAAGVINRYQDFSAANGTGILKDEWLDYSNVTSREELFNPTSTIATQFINYAGYDGAGGETSTTINWKAGGSQIQTFNANGTEMIVNYTLANGGGNVTSQSLLGAAGNDILTANNANNETLTGNGGYDIYHFGRGNGQDIIKNGIATVKTASGELDLGANIAANQVWFEKKGNDLQLDILGTKDHVTIANWFASSNAQLKEIKTADGSMIDAQLTQLVQAMASYTTAHGFNPATATQLPPDANLQHALAAAWHH